MAEVQKISADNISYAKAREVFEKIRRGIIPAEKNVWLVTFLPTGEKYLTHLW